MSAVWCKNKASDIPGDGIKEFPLVLPQMQTGKYDRCEKFYD